MVVLLDIVCAQACDRAQEIKKGCRQPDQIHGCGCRRNNRVKASDGRQTKHDGVCQAIELDAECFLLFVSDEKVCELAVEDIC